MSKLRPFFILLLLIALAPSGKLLALTFDGVFKQGGLVRGNVGEAKVKEIKLNDLSVKIGQEGDFVFGFSRDEAARVTLKITYENGQAEERVFTVEPQTYDIEYVDGLPPRTVHIPEAERQRRKVERSKVAVARAPKNEQLFWQESFVKPAEGRFSGFYGSQRVLNGTPRTPHYGLDVAAPVGTKIIAPASGVVTLAEEDFLLEGGIVIIDHGFSIFSTLFHMNSVSVVEGQFVAKGETIGTVGAKGRASGPHVDWRINWGKVRLDPMLLLENK